MLNIKKILKPAKLLAEICGGWGVLMSGPFSVIFAAWSAFSPAGHSQRYFLAFLAYAALWVMILRLAWKNYQILAIQNPEKRRVLFAKMVDFIKSTEQERERKGHSFTTYDYARVMRWPELIGVLVKFADEIQTEQDLEWYRSEFVRNSYEDPFAVFETWADELRHSQWLPVLQEARHQPYEIKTQSEFLNFLATRWSGKEKWLELSRKKGGSIPA